MASTPTPGQAGRAASSEPLHSKRDVKKTPGTVAMVTESAEGHTHIVRVFVLDAADGNLVGETTMQRGAGDDAMHHDHPFTLDLESGELMIAENDGHTHAVDAEMMAEMVESIGRQLRDGLDDEMDDDEPTEAMLMRSLNKQLPMMRTETTNGHSHPYNPNNGHIGPGGLDAHTHTVPGNEGPRRTNPGGNDGHEHGLPEAPVSRGAGDVVQGEGSGLPADVAVQLSRGDSLRGDRRAKRRLMNAEITHVSLCRRGMNGIKTMLKSRDDGGATFAMRSSLAKMDVKEGLLHSVVYLPDFVDHEGEFMSQDEIRKTAHSFLRNGGHIDVEHDGVPLGKSEIHIAEHYIIPAGDPKFAGITDDQGNSIDATGGWGLILKVHDAELLKSYEDEEWFGVSMAGRAEFEEIGKSAANDNPPTKDDFDMKPEEQDEFALKIATAVAKAVQPAPVEPVSPTLDAPDRELPTPPEDLSDNEALRAYSYELAKSKLDLSTEAGVKQLMQLNKQRDVEKAAAQPAVQKSDSAVETELEKAKREATEAKDRLAKIEKASNVPATGDADADDDTPAESRSVRGLNKSEKTGWAKGKGIAERWNKNQQQFSVNV